MFSSLTARMRISMAALALIAALALASPLAASITPMSVEVLSAVAEDVVHGTVQKQRVETVNSIPVTISTVTVIERLKGASTAADGKTESVEVVNVGGRTSYFGVTSNASVPLSEGEEVVLFLSNPGRRRLNSMGPAAANPESPFVKHPQVVGGPQGKFSVVRQQVTETLGPNTTTREVLRVSRQMVARPARSKEGLPPLGVFKDQVRLLISGAVPAGPETLTLAPNTQPLAIPQRREDLTAVRYFDPPTSTVGALQGTLAPLSLPTAPVAAPASGS